MENTLVAPYGVAGGRAGRTGRITLNPGTARERELAPLGDGFVLERGDILRFETCGGGGWGDPFTRDPERVRVDVTRGFVTARGARHARRRQDRDGRGASPTRRRAAADRPRTRVRGGGGALAREPQRLVGIAPTTTPEPRATLLPLTGRRE
jgi:N-methylhydantoinase B